MIGKISGTIDSIQKESVLIMTQSGVGYIIHCGLNSCSTLLISSTCSFWVETIVREDAISLYGFESQEKLSWFRELIKVSGVGPKLALNLLDQTTIYNITQAILTQNKSAFGKVSGLGAKTAEKIILELRNKIDLLPASSGSSNKQSDIQKDAISALLNLGFAYEKASQAVLKIENPKDLGELIQMSLRIIQSI
jgi:Holliday junction DNA helicase RuvA